MGLLTKKHLMLIRHAESCNNADGNRFSGTANTPITADGREKATELAEKLAGVSFEVVLASGLERAVETAELVCPGTPIRACEELMEFDYGDYDGLSPDELPDDDPILVQWRQSPSGLRFPGGQGVEAYAETSWGGMCNLMARTMESKIACIVHKTMGRLFVARMLGLDLDSFRSIPMDNCSISLVTWEPSEGFTLLSLNVATNLIGTAGDSIWELRC